MAKCGLSVVALLRGPRFAQVECQAPEDCHVHRERTAGAFGICEYVHGAEVLEDGTPILDVKPHDFGGVAVEVLREVSDGG